MEDASKPLPRPLRDQVLVRQDPPKDQIGSFFVPQGSEDYPPLGTVLALGSGILGDGTAVHFEIKVGDRVLFKRQADSALIPDSREGGDPTWKNLLVLNYANIYAVVED